MISGEERIPEIAVMLDNEDIVMLHHWSPFLTRNCIRCVQKIRDITIDSLQNSNGVLQRFGLGHVNERGSWSEIIAENVDGGIGKQCGWSIDCFARLNAGQEYWDKKAGQVDNFNHLQISESRNEVLFYVRPPNNSRLTELLQTKIINVLFKSCLWCWLSLLLTKCEKIAWYLKIITKPMWWFICRVSNESCIIQRKSIDYQTIFCSIITVACARINKNNGAKWCRIWSIWVSYMETSATPPHVEPPHKE